MLCCPFSHEMSRMRSGTELSQFPRLFQPTFISSLQSQAYRNMEMTREHISFTLDSRDTLLSLLMGFSFVSAAVACAILKRISGFKPSSEHLLQGT